MTINAHRDAWVISERRLLVIAQVAPLSGLEAIQGRAYSAGLQLAFANANKGAKNSTAFGSSACTSTKTGCNNIFYIKDSKIIEYAPTVSVRGSSTICVM